MTIHTYKLKFVNKFQHLSKSIWFFPILLLLPLSIATIFQVSGSSIGVYHELFYGKQIKDNNLIANKPRPIRSDEWLVTTQQTIAQSENNFSRHNKNIGDGQDMSIIDVPYKEWSIIFKPHNLIFFILPFGSAFAFKWWVMGYLLIVSAYIFIVSLMPKKKLLAVLLSIALFFSAFIQWWYTYGTLGSIYYSLFIASVVMCLFKTDVIWKKILLGLALSYLLVCFALILYPPFQIACGLVLLVFILSFIATNYHVLGRKKILQSIFSLVVAGVVGVVIVGLYLFTRIEVVKTINNTAYPGQRSVQSGTFFPRHFLSSHLGYQFVSETRTAKYFIDDKNPSNQSETSNFLLLIPFLIIPLILLLYYSYKESHVIEWYVLGLLFLYLIFSMHLFVREFTYFSKFIMLNKVGDARLLIGMGLLNFLGITFFINGYSKLKRIFPPSFIMIYCSAILAIELSISLLAHYNFDGFISLKRAILFSLPLPAVVFFILRRRFVLAIMLYLIFSVFISVRVNPLYRGFSVITKTPISAAVKEIGSKSEDGWVSDGGYIEHIAVLNGEPSLAGVYLYPQHSLWSDIDSSQKNIYNRYAHVGFQYFNNDAETTRLSLVTPDSFVVKTPICGDYLRDKNVKYVISLVLLDNHCVKLMKNITYPYSSLYIYELNR